MVMSRGLDELVQVWKKIVKSLSILFDQKFSFGGKQNSAGAVPSTFTKTSPVGFLFLNWKSFVENI